MYRRALIYAALALAVPLPALALTGGDGEGGQEPLSVSASLDSCGTAADTIVCKIDASWNQIEGADEYRASVTRADGSVVDFGTVGAGSESFWVPYVGNGTYTVTISAYGDPPGPEPAKRVARDSSPADTEEGAVSGKAPKQQTPGPEDAAGEIEEAGAVEEPRPTAPPEPPEEECADPEEGAGKAVEPAAAPVGAATGPGQPTEARSAPDESTEAAASARCAHSAEATATSGS